MTISDLYKAKILAESNLERVAIRNVIGLSQEERIELDVEYEQAKRQADRARVAYRRAVAEEAGRRDRAPEARED